MDVANRVRTQCVSVRVQKLKKINFISLDIEGERGYLCSLRIPKFMYYER